MSKKKKKKKKTALPVNQQATTRSGGITTYYRKGKECHCASKRPAGSTEERDRRRAKRSERQRLLTSVFAFVDRLVKILQRKLVGANSWVPFAKDTSMTAPNLCHKVNGTACDEHGVENFRAFVFSVGWLAVPLYTHVRRDGWTFTLEWLHLPAVTRAAGTVTFTLPDPEGPGREPLSPETVVHIYPYLASPDTDEYTRSVYLRVPPGADDTLG